MVGLGELEEICGGEGGLFMMVAVGATAIGFVQPLALSFVGSSFGVLALPLVCVYCWWYASNRGWCLCVLCGCGRIVAGRII